MDSKLEIQDIASKSLQEEQNKITPLRFGGPIGVTTKSMRPVRSIKRLSVLPKRFTSISRVQKTIRPQEKTPESV